MNAVFESFVEKRSPSLDGRKNIWYTEINHLAEIICGGRKFAAAYPGDKFVQQPAAQISWGHNVARMDKLTAPRNAYGMQKEAPRTVGRAACWFSRCLHGSAAGWYNRRRKQWMNS